MDVKFIMWVIIGLIILLLLMREMYIINRQIDDTNKLIMRKNEELKIIIKSETNKLNDKFGQCSSDIVRQFRTMNAIEEQKIINMSECDRFVESDGNNENDQNNKQPNMVHLSDTFKVDISKNKLSEQSRSYMSNTENDDNIANNETSQEITFGSKATEITQPNEDNENNEDNNENQLEKDNVSNATSIPLPASDKNSVCSNHSRLGKITTYTKQQLSDIAGKYSIEIYYINKGKTKELTKKELYEKIKFAQNTKE